MRRSEKLHIAASLLSVGHTVDEVASRTGFSMNLVKQAKSVNSPSNFDSQNSFVERGPFSDDEMEYGGVGLPEYIVLDKDLN